MQTMADLLAIRGVATFRYQFPYVEKGKKKAGLPGDATRHDLVCS